jgi:F-type H+-transporting ATPase subunit epsilon
MAELDVALVAADREVWSGKASMVVAKTADGNVGIMPKHQPILSQLKPSEISINTVVDGQAGEVLRAVVHGGFISVADDRVSLLAEAAELIGEIDANRAQQALESARAGEFGADSDAAAARAQLRLHAVGRGE